MSDDDPIAEAVRVIELSEGFCLVLLVGIDATQRAGLQAIARRLPAERSVRWHDIERDGIDLVEASRAGSAGQVLLVHGLPEAESDWVELARRLNLSRDALASKRRAIVLWLSAPVADQFVLASPDLFALRSLFREVPADHLELSTGNLYSVDLDEATIEAHAPRAVQTTTPLHQPEGTRRLEFGDVLGGRYIIASRLAGGPFTRVFDAWDAESTPYTPVAIKALRPAAWSQVAHREWLVGQGELLSEFDTPHLLKIFDVRDEADATYLVMEKLAGTTHRELWSPPAMKETLSSVASALLTLHAAGAVHGRVCPGNVSIDAERERVVLIDCAPRGRVMPYRADGREYWDGPAYVAPEVALERGPVTAAVDVFSLAMLCVRSLYGARLPARAGWQPAQFIARLDRPPRVLAVLVRATATDPADRYLTVDAFMAALTEAGGL